MSKLLAFSLILMSMVSTAYAQNCSNVDISEELGAVRDQGNVGWCFANASADLLSHAYRKELGNTKISAMYTALSYDRLYYANVREILGEKLQKRPQLKDATLKLYEKAFPHGIGEGGLMYLAMYSAMRNGMCLQELDQSFSFDPNSKMTLMEKLQMGLKMKKEYDKYEKSHRRGWEMGALPIVQKIRESENIMNRISDDSMKQILANTTKDNFLVTVGDVLCRRKMFTPKKYYQVRWTTSAIKYLNSTQTVRNNLGNTMGDMYAAVRGDVVNWFDNHVTTEIDNNLNRKNPVGVLYYSTLFKGWDEKINYGTDLHASVIVGRRWIPAKKLPRGQVVKGRCEYKIRNSWGADCKGYKNAEISASCVKGHVWVDRERYKKYLYATTTIDTTKIDKSQDQFPWLKVITDYKRSPIIFAVDK